MAHADHDGIGAAAGLLEKFPETKVVFSKSFRVRTIKVSKEKTVVFADVQPSRELVLELLGRGKLVINLDHHDPLRVVHPHYFNLNPKLKGRIFASSSTVVHEIFETRKTAWAQAAGALVDICAEDSMDLVKKVENVGSWKDAYWTDTYFAGRAILSFSNELGPERTLSLVLQNRKFFYAKAAEEKKRLLERASLTEERIIEETDSYVIIDGNGCELGLAVALNLVKKDERVYVAIYDRKTCFRRFFGDWRDLDVSLIARRLGGGGTHPRTGSAPVTDIAKVRQALQDSKTTIFSFF